MFRIGFIFALTLILTPAVGNSQARVFSLSGAEPLVENGFLQFLLPRFSLKTGIAIDLHQDANIADLFFGKQGDVAVMEGLGETWYIRFGDTQNTRLQNVQKFVDWLQSDVGRRTIEQFSQNGESIFSAARVEIVELPDIIFDGDLTRGQELAFSNCARCHEIGTKNLMKGIGSTPSFGLLRGLPDWQERFMTFYLRAPHPTFTQIAGVTEPFDQAHPPTIVPLELSQSDVDDILTYVATVEPVDLGAPLVVHQ